VSDPGNRSIVRLGGMALPNGVLVHGPSAWACAVRDAGGGVQVVARRKRLRAERISNPLLRGPARLIEAFAVVPQAKRALPAARLPFQRPRVIATVVAAAAAGRLVRATRVGAAGAEVAGALLSLVPPLVALRGGELAAYHGAEHITIGSYEHGEPRPKEHERCGSHLIGPLLVTGALGNLAARTAPAPLQKPARIAAAAGSAVAATEVFRWMTTHPEHPLARVLARPGHELQRRIATAEPSAAQLEVAEAALEACLDLEHSR
jgi:uncharacterized protein YqhQ